MRKFRRGDGTEVRLYTNSAQLPEGWSALIPPKHFLELENIRRSESYGFPDLSFLYAVASRNGSPVAVAYFQVYQLRKDNLDEAQLSQAQRLAWRGFVNTLRPKLLVAGHLFRHDICSFYWHPQQSDYEAYQLYQACIQKALRASCAMAVLAKDIPVSLATYFQHYAPEYMLLRNDISMEMHIPGEWQSMKDYEKSLKHKYAQRFRKVRQRWNELEIRELNTREVGEQKENIYSLYKQVSNRQQVRLGFLSKEYLPALKRENPEQLKVWMAWHEGQPVAFFSAWLLNGTFDMFYIGLDYSENEKLQLYFNILFFAVEQGIQFNKKKIILGRTALEAKARVGCKPRYLSTFLYIRNSMVRQVISTLQQRIHSQEGEWENRHPFKEHAPE